MAWHNADFAFFGGNDAWAVGADQAAVGARKRAFHPHHVQNGDALGDADDQCNAGVNGFANRIGSKGRGDVNHGCIAIGGGRDLALEQEATDVVEPTKLMRDYLESKLADIGVTAPVEHHWAAIVSYTDSGLPIVKEVQPGVWAVGAYCGTGNVVGALLARSVVDQCIAGHSQVASDFAS